MISLENAKRIGDGAHWHQARMEEVTWLAEQAVHHSSIVEIGAWMGVTTRALADNTSGSVTVIDSWDGGTDVPIQDILKGKPADWAYNQFLANTSDLTNLVVFRKDSLAAACEFASWGGKFDMIFLDASHDYESVIGDLLAWRPLLSEGGLLCGDDFSEVHFPGLVKAVKEVLPKARRVAGAFWISE